MINKVATVMAIVLFSPPALANWYEEKDKQQHLAASFALASAISFFTKEKYYAIGITMGVGLAKEYTDSKVDPGDVGANMLGAMLTIPIEF